MDEVLLEKVLKLELLVDLQKKEIDILHKMIDNNTEACKTLFDVVGSITKIISDAEVEGD